MVQVAGNDVAGGNLSQRGPMFAAVVPGLGAARIEGTALRWGWEHFVGHADAVTADMGVGQGHRS